MRTIQAKDLPDRLEQNPDLRLIDLMDAQPKEGDHLPGSVHVPNVNFILNQYGKDEEIVLYAASGDQEKVEEAYHLLDKKGFTNLWCFVF